MVNDLKGAGSTKKVTKKTISNTLCRNGLSLLVVARVKEGDVEICAVARTNQTINLLCIY